MFLFMNILRDLEHCPKLIPIFTGTKPHSPSVCADIPPSRPMEKQWQDCDKNLQRELLYLSHKINFLRGFKWTSQQANKFSFAFSDTSFFVLSFFSSLFLWLSWLGLQGSPCSLRAPVMLQTYKNSFLRPLLELYFSPSFLVEIMSFMVGAFPSVFKLSPACATYLTKLGNGGNHLLTLSLKLKARKWES